MKPTVNRTVAIVGRPNVGKSALFNRLVRRRLAIVHEESGVTRDRVVCETTWDQERFELIDTGGLGQFDGARGVDVFDEGIQLQIKAAIEDCAVLIFVVDITSGVLPLDEQVAKNLHECGRPVFIAANKADNENLEKNIPAFASLGFPLFPVSALHNRGIGDLVEEVIQHLPEATATEQIEPLNVAIVGKPNVGKSSFINRLLRNDRVIVSDIPGTTRDSIEIPFVVGQGEQARHYRLVDTAGMRRNRKIRNAVEKFSVMRAENSIKRADIVVHVLDASQPPGSQDKKISALIKEHEKGALILVNKWDLSEETQRTYVPELTRAMPFLRHVPVVFVSSKTGYNIRKSIEAIDHVAGQVRMTLSTGVLNRVLRDAFERTTPPLVRGKRLKLYYTTQVGAQPIRIKLFVNYPRALTANYRSYLINSLRAAFGLEGAPVVLHCSARRPENNR